MTDKIKIMVVDDSIAYRTILTSVLKGIEGVEVIGTAANGKMMLDKIPLLKPDMITLDIEMPVMDGLEALKHLEKDYQDIGVVMVSGANEGSAKQTMKALSLGCLEFVVKPECDSRQEAEKELTDQISRVIKIFRFRLKRRLLGKQKTTLVQPTSSPIGPKTKSSLPTIVNIVLIGSSTGGPKALEKVIPKLPKNFHVPVLIVQHMPKLFTVQLANRLDKLSAVTVKEGENMEKAVPGHVYIAPGGLHMTVSKNESGFYIKINEDPPENSCRPAVDVLYRSAAKYCNANQTLCVILTGMGSDGVKGVKVLKEAGGGYCITQSEDSCVVYGMPRSIVEAGLDSEVYDLDDISDRIVKIVR